MRRVYEVDDVRRLIDDGAQIVEVLPAAEYGETHLPGAVNIPLKELTADAVAKLDSERTVVVYCYDVQCDLSPRAGVRFELLGFSDVVDYVPGKAAWLGAGQPTEGRLLDADRIGAIVRQDIGQCTPDETVADIEGRFGEWPVCVVLAGDVVVGVVRPEVLGLKPDTRVGDVLQPGPGTVRPDVPRVEMAKRFEKDSLTYVIVTTNAGRFLGALRPPDVTIAA